MVLLRGRNLDINECAAIIKNISKGSDFIFAKNTTYGLGGAAEIAYYPENLQEACALTEFLLKTNKEFCVIGGGSDILASDSGYEGAVISTKKLDKIRYSNGYLYCQSGVKVSKLLSFCKERGLSGLEYLAGIPATVGGLAFMNAGISCRHIEQDIVSVYIFDGKLRKLSNVDCKFSNKHSTMRDIKCLILSMKLKIEQKSSEIVKQNIDYYLSRRSALPKGRSCGCIFKNPDNVTSAGKIIEMCGLKGYKFGCARVSCGHANFIINNGCSSSDIYSLIKYVKSEVYKKTRIALEEEVVYIGKFNDSDC